MQAVDVMFLGRIACTRCRHAASCYGCLCTCLLDTTASPAKEDELIEMPFGLSTRVGPRNHVLGGVTGSSQGKDNFEELFPQLKCIRLCDQQTLQQHRAADSSAGDSASRRKRGFRMDSPAAGLTDAGRCGLSSKLSRSFLSLFIF